MSRERKLTTIGLMLRDDLLIRSLVQVIRTKTDDDWTFHDGFEADVILCNPDSNLSGVAVRRVGHSATLACVSVVHDGHEPLQDTRMLHAPIKSLDLITLLNDISRSGAHEHRAAHATTAANEDRTLADVLHELMQTKSTELHTIESNSATLLVTPATRTLHALAPLSDTEVERWLDVSQVRIRCIGRQHSHRAESQFSLDKLLWQIGLMRSGSRLLRCVPAEARFKLKHWPDFGALAHQPFHFRMAALLSRNALTIEQLATASNHTLDDARSFINACAICDLLRVDEISAAELQRNAAAAPQRRYSSILRSIRSALGLRA